MESTSETSRSLCNALRMTGRDTPKCWAMAELAYGKLIHIRGFEWVIAPRVYVRTLTGKFAVFYAASPEMVAEFKRLVKELKVFRSMR